MIYLDLETGGLSARMNQIFTIGIVFETGEEHLIPVAYDRRKPVNPGALRVNGIDLSTWEGYPLDKAMRIAADILGEHRLVAHNASFDRGFLLQAAKETGLHVANPWSCTLDWSRRIPQLRGLRSRNLAKLHEHLLGFRPEKCHDALEDSRSCMRIARKLRVLDPDEEHLRIIR